MPRRLLAAGLLLLPAGVSSQAADAWRDSTIRLSQELRAVRDSIALADEHLVEVARRSNLVLAATGRYRSAGTEILAAFDSGRKRLFGDRLPTPDGFRIVLRHERQLGPYGEKEEALSVSGLPDRAHAPRVTPVVPRRELQDAEGAARVLLFQYGQLMLAGTSAEVQRWLPSGLLLHLAEATRREEAMYALVTGIGPAQRGCVLGDLADCAYALGLRSSARGDAGGTYYPLARADLLLQALQLGGAGAWDRLVSVDGSVEEQLAAAAAMPADSLVSSWRTGLLAIRPDHAPIDGAAVLLLLGWCMAAGLVLLGVARWV